VEFDLTLPDGGRLHAYDTGGDDRLAVLWHHGTPNIGAPPKPLFAAADRLGLRWIAYDRPGYGGSPRTPGRTVGSAGTYATAVADALGIERFAVMGHSGGGSHALATAALLPDRVLAVVSAAGLAPPDAQGLDWWAGMGDSGVAALTAAREGLAVKEAFERSGVEYDHQFSPADFAAFESGWSWFSEVVGPAEAGGPGGHVDDDIAYVTPWGCDPAQITAPVLLIHGGRDKVVPSGHAEWLAKRCPRAELRLIPDGAHISVMTSGEAALEWIRSAAS
jgi:pimeloyl-ACP methyl ester carboxylesterase